MNTRFITPGAIKAVVACALTFSAHAWAAGGYIYDSVGEVSIDEGNSTAHTASNNDLFPSNTLINTGDRSYAVLKFEDGQVVAMQANSAIQIKEYRYDSANSGKDSISFSNFAGGVLINNEIIGQLNHTAVRLSSPNVTINIDHAELLVVTSNDNLYARIISGSISMTNAAGVAAFTTGQTILAKSPNSLPIVIPSAALPPGIFSQFDAIHIPPAALAPTARTRTTAIKNTAPDNTSAATPIPLAAQDTDDTPVQAYAVANVLCDFCTSNPPTPIAHLKVTPSAGEPVTGEPTLFGRHNLTPTGANTGEICAFCHTPQGTENLVSAPRWNRTFTTLSSYRAYSSLGSAVQEATGSISMACLSCHDGSQAPNIVINTPTLLLDSGKVKVNIGNALRNHHPVGIQYAGGGQNQNAPDIPLDPVAAIERLKDFNKFASESPSGNIFTSISPNRYLKRRDADAFNDVLTFSKQGAFNSTKGGFNKSTYSGTGNGTVWWVKTPGSKNGGRQKTDLYLFTRTDTIDTIPSESVENRPYVECATCHDPHSTNSTFLRTPGGNARSQICLTCHNK